MAERKTETGSHKTPSHVKDAIVKRREVCDYLRACEFNDQLLRPLTILLCQIDAFLILLI